MKICKWIIVAVAENGMREVYHCKLFAWFGFALHLKIKQRNSWYEHCILLPIIILWGLNMLTLQWQSNQGVPKQMQIQSQPWYHIVDLNHPFSIKDFKMISYNCKKTFGTLVVNLAVKRVIFKFHLTPESHLQFKWVEYSLAIFYP